MQAPGFGQEHTLPSTGEALGVVYRKPRTMGVVSGGSPGLEESRLFQAPPHLSAGEVEGGAESPAPG